MEKHLNKKLNVVRQAKFMDDQQSVPLSGCQNIT
jgi:hypothetical protein